MEAGVEIKPPPADCEKCFNILFRPEAVSFLTGLIRRFDEEVTEIMRNRMLLKLDMDKRKTLPDFLPETSPPYDDNWKVKDVPSRVRCRWVDLGDVSPSCTKHFVAALNSPAQGIQVDFDDGHCPTWSNQLRGLYNVYLAVWNELEGVPSISTAPVLMMRPRAWNMTEHNIMIDGKQVYGALMDFSLLFFHNARRLIECESGPFFYLPKLEGHLEARLWNNIFTYAENIMGIPVGTIKACVLIENVLAAFEMDEILYELRDHSLGLNCGMWDYSASFLNKFGERPEFLLPDRSKYVSMTKPFLKNYQDLLIKTCHKRNCHATGGMSAQVLPSDAAMRAFTVDKVTGSKSSEILAGVDGFLVYDISLVEPMQLLFQKNTSSITQITISREDVSVTARDLLLMPPGGITKGGLQHNILVGVLFIYNWFHGRGHFCLKGAVEDSATAEISRSQVWQWIRHQAHLEDSDMIITRGLIRDLLLDLFADESLLNIDYKNEIAWDKQKLCASMEIFEEIICQRQFPEFITTYLNDCFKFQHYQS